MQLKGFVPKKKNRIAIFFFFYQNRRDCPMTKWWPELTKTKNGKRKFPWNWNSIWRNFFSALFMFIILFGLPVDYYVNFWIKLAISLILGLRYELLKSDHLKEISTHQICQLILKWSSLIEKAIDYVFRRILYGVKFIFLPNFSKKSQVACII